MCLLFAVFGWLVVRSHVARSWPSGLSANRVKLKAFSKFEDTNKALAAAAAICDGKLDKGLKKFLKATCVEKKLKVRRALASFADGECNFGV